MRIRLTGTPEEVAVWVDVLRQAVDVHEASTFIPWTRNDPLSKTGAIYVTAELTAEDQQRVVHATATRLDRDQSNPLPRNNRRAVRR